MQDTHCITPGSTIHTVVHDVQLGANSQGQYVYPMGILSSKLCLALLFPIPSHWKAWPLLEKVDVNLLTKIT